MSDYFRVISAPHSSGYLFRTGEPDALLNGEPVRPEPFFEFDDLESVGKWLFLGERVLQLRLPEGARCERNTPSSQGGCMRYSADRIERVAVLTIPELITRMDEAGLRPDFLYLAGLDLDQRFLPAAGVTNLRLDRCRGALDLRAVDQLTLEDCTLRVHGLPAQLERLFVSNTTLLGVTALPPAASAYVEGLELRP